MALDADRTTAAPVDASKRARRAALFRETPAEMLERWALGTAWTLKPDRLSGLPALARTWVSDLLSPNRELPDARHALDRPAGLCGIAHDFSAEKLVEAYRRGLFTFAHLGPLKWLSPPERCVLFFNEIHIGKNLRRQLRQGRHHVTFDRDFEGVIKACAGRRPGKWHVTWITPRIMRTYADLFDAGYVHSFEVWNQDGALVGGGYGVALGRVFFTESQFSREPNTSKIGFTVLNWHLNRWGYVLNDGKWATPTILDMGFRLIPRNEFLGQLDRHAQGGGTGSWQVEADSAAIANWAPASPSVAPAAQPQSTAVTARTSSGRRDPRKGLLLYPAADVIDGEVMGFSVAGLGTVLQSLFC